MNTVKERPILFSGPMVRAIIEGRKTQTRRVVKPRFGGEIIGWGGQGVAMESIGIIDGCENIKTNLCPYGMPSERLWVRETFCPIYPQQKNYNGGRPIDVDYKATYEHGYRMGDRLGIKKTWKPSIHMPRDLSRILLEITNVRVQRLQDISAEDAIEEGIYLLPGGGYKFAQGEQEHDTAVEAYRDLWVSINGPDSWDLNDWVWAITFKKVRTDNVDGKQRTT